MRKHKTICIAVLLGIFFIGQIQAYMAATVSAQSGKTTSTPGSPPVSPSFITLGSGIKVSFVDAGIWQQPGGNILSYTLRYANGSGRNASLTNYFSKVATPGGSILQGRPVKADELKKTLISKNTVDVTYYVNIGQIQTLSGMKFPVYVWDANAKGYLKQAGTFKLPANYADTTPFGKSLNANIGDIPVTASAKSLEIYRYNGKAYAKAGVNITNRGKKPLADPGFSAYLVSAGGSRFELALSDAGYNVQPQEKKTIYYVAEIPPYLKTTGMKLAFTQKDETLKLEFAKWSFQLPNGVEPGLVVNPGQSKKIGVQNNTIEIRLQNADVSAEDGKGSWSLQLQVKNWGNKPVTMPTYRLAVKTSEGKSFPVEAKGLSGLTLKPLEEKVIQLYARIPLELEQSKLLLEMVEEMSSNPEGKSGSGGKGSGPAGLEGTGGSDGSNGQGAASNGTKLNIPVAYFAIPYSLHADSRVGSVYTATNSYGSFSYGLESLHRFPWKDQDIVIAKLNITNTQSTSLKLPELKGALKMDALDESAATELFMDQNVSSLAPGKSIEMNIFAKIPYSVDFRTLKLELYAMENEEKTGFLTLTTPGTVNSLDLIEKGGSYAIPAPGKQATVEENKTLVYEGSHSNIIYTEMFLSSEEKRQIDMARLHAYFRAGDGELFEAVANQPDTAAAPGIKQLVVFRAKMPKSVSVSDLELVLGTGINGTKYSGPGEEATAFINVSAMMLSAEFSPPSGFSAVSLTPYTLSVLQAEGKKAEGSDSIQISINYDLLRNGSFDAGDMDHKLILRMTDPYGQSQEKSLAFGTDLIEGSGNTYMVTFTNPMYKELTGGGYTLTLYEDMMRERIELASQSYGLFVEKSPKLQ